MSCVIMAVRPCFISQFFPLNKFKGGNLVLSITFIPYEIYIIFGRCIYQVKMMCLV